MHGSIEHSPVYTKRNDWLKMTSLCYVLCKCVDLNSNTSPVSTERLSDISVCYTNYNMCAYVLNNNTYETSWMESVYN